MVGRCCVKYGLVLLERSGREKEEEAGEEVGAAEAEAVESPEIQGLPAGGQAGGRVLKGQVAIHCSCTGGASPGPVNKRNLTQLVLREPMWWDYVCDFCGTMANNFICVNQFIFSKNNKTGLV
jgi:hypothetical protein